MPPKGWRKTPEGFKPTNSSGAPLENRKRYGLDDLLLPRTLVQRIARDALPESTQLPKDGVTALQRSATVFVSYVSAEANKISRQAGRKTVTPSDITKALEQLQFGAFVPLTTELVEALAEIRAQQEDLNASEKPSDNISASERKANDGKDLDKSQEEEDLADEEDIEEDIEPEIIDPVSYSGKKLRQSSTVLGVVEVVDQPVKDVQSEMEID